MEVTRKQAEETLQEVDAVAQGVRGHVAYGVVGPILMVWGAVWMACFAVVHFAPRISGWAWLVGNALGIAGSLYFGRFHPRARAVRSESARRVGWRVFWFWLFLFVYADIWLAVLWPWRGEQLGVFLVTLVMFAYVVMGLWLEVRFLLWLGLLVTALAGGGYALSLVAPAVLGVLDLWLGAAGGGALLASGAYLALRWR